MSVPSFPAVSFHSILHQTPSRSKNIRQNKPLTFLRRVLRSGLFLLVLVFLPALAFPADLTIAWNPNTEPDLEGYGVYFKKNVSGPPYDLFGNVVLAELSDPDSPSFSLTDLQKGSRYYITLTAYDTAGNESGYADPVCVEIGDQIVPCPSADTGGGTTGSGVSSGGGSGGGAACFIATSLNHSHPHATIAAFLFCAGCLFLKKIFIKHKRRMGPICAFRS